MSAWPDPDSDHPAGACRRFGPRFGPLPRADDGCDRACRNNCSCNRLSKPFFTIVPYHLRQFARGGASQERGGGFSARGSIRMSSGPSARNESRAPYRRFAGRKCRGRGARRRYARRPRAQRARNFGEPAGAKDETRATSPSALPPPPYRDRTRRPPRRRQSRVTVRRAPRDRTWRSTYVPSALIASAATASSRSRTGTWSPPAIKARSR